jgi:hypothetical protein
LNNNASEKTGGQSDVGSGNSNSQSPANRPAATKAEQKAAEKAKKHPGQKGGGN